MEGLIRGLFAKSIREVARKDGISSEAKVNVVCCALLEMAP